MHGGALAIDSKVGVGTSVTVKFPPERTLSGRTAAA
jgi:signal transduction histidine kinase